MSNPYLQQSLTNYNASAPPDDGTQVTNNAVKWSNHITKIGDPLKTYAQAIDAATLAAFALTFGASIREVSAGYTVDTDDRGRFLSVTNTVTVTLIAAVTAGNGFPILIANVGSGNVTIDGNASETINGLTTIVLGPGMSAVLTCNGANWFGQVSAGSSSGTFTANWVGFTTAQATTWEYTRTGRVVTMRPQAAISATSDSALFTSGASDVPAEIRPTAIINLLFILTDNGTQQIGRMQISNGLILFNPTVSDSTFVTSGTKGFDALQEVTYQLDN